MLDYIKNLLVIDTKKLRWMRFNVLEKKKERKKSQQSLIKPKLKKNYINSTYTTYLVFSILTDLFEFLKYLFPNYTISMCIYCLYNFVCLFLHVCVVCVVMVMACTNSKIMEKVLIIEISLNKRLSLLIVVVG